MMERIRGIDYGDVRIGIAMSDETAFLASPLVTVRARRAAAPVEEYGVES
jgi:RNase H-fold protein (predicted Holliday junction resolvase)